MTASTCEMSPIEWFASLARIASKHKVDILDDPERWQELYETGTWPELAFFSEHPEHRVTI